jgi:tRNA (guanine10-N2)-methyltransferase
MEYLIRFIQMHEEFRKPEIESIAELLHIQFTWVSYIENVGQVVDRWSPEVC